MPMESECVYKFIISKSEYSVLYLSQNDVIKFRTVPSFMPGGSFSQGKSMMFG